jgi:hypothetical protein
MTGRRIHRPDLKILFDRKIEMIVAPDAPEQPSRRHSHAIASGIKMR